MPVAGSISPRRIGSLYRSGSYTSSFFHIARAVAATLRATVTFARFGFVPCSAQPVVGLAEGIGAGVSDHRRRRPLEDHLERPVEVEVQTTRLGHPSPYPLAVEPHPVRRRARHHPEAAVRPELPLRSEPMRGDDDRQQLGHPYRPQSGRRLRRRSPNPATV